MHTQTKAILDAHHDELLSMPNVQGIGCGMKWYNGRPSNDQAILVFVEKKKSIPELIAKHSAAAIVPKSIDGTKTDVLSVGVISKHAFTSKIRPIQPGYSTGHRLVTAGTISGFFYDRDNDVVALSNNHIFANENAAAIGDLIYQPGPIDNTGSLQFVGWPSVNTKNLPYYATLKRFNTIRSSGLNYHDSAIAKIHPSFLSAKLINPTYPIIGKTLTGFGAPTINMPVQKDGRTTGRTSGRVIALHATFTVGYDFGTAQFADCVVLTNMSAGGDSGSLILDGSMRGVALLFAGSPTVTIANPINYVVDYYGLRPYTITPSAAPIPPAPPAPPPSYRDQQQTVPLSSIWSLEAGSGQIGNDGRALIITANANCHCIARRPFGSFRMITTHVNVGSDTGATWGPGIVLNYVGGAVKLNIRHDGFGGAFNGNEFVIQYPIDPGLDYLLRIRTVGQELIGDVNDGTRTIQVFNIPKASLTTPLDMYVGKTDVQGGLTDFSTPGDRGSCRIYYPAFS